MDSFTLDDPAPSGEVVTAADAILGAMPEPQQHAIDQRDEQDREAEATVERDAVGAAFDSLLHTGSKLKSGEWRKRKVAGSPTSIVAKSRAKKGAPQVEQQKATAEACARAAGAAAAGSLFMLGRALGGEEWEPTDPEVAMQVEAWGTYFIAKGINDFPPGVALTVAIAGYAMPRFAMPKTQTKMQRFKLWIAVKYIRWKFKRKGENVEVFVKDGAVHVKAKEPEIVATVGGRNASR